MSDDKRGDDDKRADDDKRRDDEGGERRAKLAKAGYAVGIGSAAIVAALLYASKVKRPKRGGTNT